MTHDMNAAKEKFDRIFAVSPWLRTSKNVIHLPIPDPDYSDRDKPAHLPGVTWAEIYDLIQGE